MARLAQSAERTALNLVVVGSSPTVGVELCPFRRQGRGEGVCPVYPVVMVAHDFFVALGIDSVQPYSSAGGAQGS